jgi:hypothetical protein
MWAFLHNSVGSSSKKEKPTGAHPVPGCPLAHQPLHFLGTWPYLLFSDVDLRTAFWQKRSI